MEFFPEGMIFKPRFVNILGGLEERVFVVVIYFYF